MNPFQVDYKGSDAVNTVPIEVDWKVDGENPKKEVPVVETVVEEDDEAPEQRPSEGVLMEPVDEEDTEPSQVHGEQIYAEC